MKYETFRYLFPPRPETAAAPTTLNVYEAQGWWSQAKMNGTGTVLFVPPDRQSFAMGRHGAENRIGWQPGSRWEAVQAHLPGAGWYVLVGELLHSKGVGVHDTLFLHDLLVDDGRYLVNVTYRERYQRLSRLCAAVPGERVYKHTHVVVAPGVWLAVNHTRGFSMWFDSISKLPAKAPVEGLVFKAPDAKLVLCGSASANSKWQAKCRRATDHLSF